MQLGSNNNIILIWLLLSMSHNINIAGRNQLDKKLKMQHCMWDKALNIDKSLSKTEWKLKCIRIGCELAEVLVMC